MSFISKTCILAYIECLTLKFWHRNSSNLRSCFKQNVMNFIKVKELGLALSLIQGGKIITYQEAPFNLCTTKTPKPYQNRMFFLYQENRRTWNGGFFRQTRWNVNGSTKFRTVIIQKVENDDGDFTNKVYIQNYLDKSQLFWTWLDMTKCFVKCSKCEIQ